MENEKKREKRMRGGDREEGSGKRESEEEAGKEEGSKKIGNGERSWKEEKKEDANNKKKYPLPPIKKGQHLPRTGRSRIKVMCNSRG